MSEEKQDLEVECKDCGDTFTWEAGEQDFCEKKCWTPPVRCKPCRKAAKEARKSQGA